MLLTLLTASVLAQSGQKCVTVGSTRTCGFECVDNGSRGACTLTASGVCAKNSSTVLCFDPPNYLTTAYSGEVPKPACETDGNAIACGYDCKKGGGKVACAATPVGLCVREYGVITCFDPPPEVYGVFGKSVPAPTCKVQDGRVACGYGCLAGAGQLACAKTPFGVCAEAGGAPICFDPDKVVICAKGTATPKGDCIKQATKVICGYQCTRGGDEIACAKTPDGSCDTGGPGRPVCFDPPVRGGTAACLEAAASR